MRTIDRQDYAGQELGKVIRQTYRIGRGDQKKGGKEIRMKEK